MKSQMKLAPKPSTKLKTSLVKYIAITSVLAVMVFISVFIINNLGISKDAIASPTAYDNYQTISIDHTKIGDSTNLIDFPVLIELNETYLKTTSNGGSIKNNNGYDIEFTNSDGSLILSHQLISYDGSTGALSAWVKIPLLSASSNTIIRMYYGKSGITSNPSTNSTWNSSYNGVWNLENNFNDATSNSNNGINHGSSSDTGKIGLCRNFDGTNDYIQIPETANLHLANQITVSAWVRTDDNLTAKIVEKETWNSGWTIDQDKWNGWKVGVITTTGNYRIDWGEGIPDYGRWYNIVMTFDGSSLKLYIDGQLKNSVSVSGTIKLNNEAVSIGSDNGGQKFFDGAIDEVHFCNVSQSADWIATAYNNQNSTLSELIITNPTASQLLISEYAANGHNGEKKDEFIELYNLSASTIDLSNCYLKLFENKKNNKNQIGATLQLTGTLLPDSFCVIAIRNKNNEPTSALTYDIQAPTGWDLKKDRFVELISDSTIIDNAGSLLDLMDDENYERTDVLADGTDVDNHWKEVSSSVSSPGAGNFSDIPPIIVVTASSNYTSFGGNGLEAAIKIKSKGSSHPGNTKVKVKRGKQHPHTPNGTTTIKRYVEIEPTTQPDNVDMVFYYNDSELNGLNEASLALFSWYDNSWHPQGGVVDVVNNTITVTFINHFSDWTAGEGTGGLPIELLSFDANYNGKTVDLSWKTATETNNDFFTIERSIDAKNYEIIGKVIGAGNSNSILNYTYEDKEPLTNTYYYRLKQTDYDGKFEYFPPVAVNIGSAAVESQLSITSVGPNPFKSEFSIEFDTENPEPVEVYLYNIRGQIVYKDIYQPSEGRNSYTYSDQINLTTGYYILSIKQNQNFSKGIKIVKE
ncbi:MAG: DUF2341 domain-containing protein [Saprospiraceae bacterium]|nr:DUF2341 domain-containing protein [Saprospiraceae bacterium]